MDEDLVTGNSDAVDGAAAPAGGTPGTSPADGAAEPADGEAPKRRRGRPKGSTAKTTRVITMTLTVSGSADGEWQAELKQGSSWVARGLPVSATAVSQAAAALHPDLAGPVDEVIETARSAKAARVAELEAELEQAKKALAELEE
ncbi:hypothetical protein Ae168Ps1_1126 [Pseudonocardia sp. Ae168_Ps1]|uniref:DUF6319 family protein n=1 Tax=unclassified Pseudonocardia TaxID=2619320 RepID=UPI0006CB0DBC|nr:MULTISPECIES: DUF6319 family protein [unclassified Pseudonocardia]ALE73091.1 hypothetical protein FRP1_08260 [Pseudonocardia sp. EC080625-04]ALL76410.1 hypothetical protein AD006_15820 [Pseudonocardia sp. EC080610-09]ALL83437.1 hypothetical protein AD017_23660 [Pseudonocardia sp. EC080619-01]OLL72747.1 hypothetical protein Ae150APs1_1125 [Pseudonocardia sp. Ae150A_Ps1]OLL78720.1 hypothetical protein Ae168Ps1_1126 [Pseudonocardia sp. Ae168_Ps1]